MRNWRRCKGARRRAVFFDRDGTLNEMVYDETHGRLDSPFCPEDLQLRPGAAEAVRAAAGLGYLTIVVTNQPGLAKGTLTEARLEAIHARLRALLGASGAMLDGIYHCPHHPRGAVERWRGECACRKPAPGMLLEAATHLGIDLGASWMVGDGLNDIEAARLAGSRAVLVSPLKLEILERFIDSPERRPEAVVPDLAAALEVIRGAAEPAGLEVAGVRCLGEMR